MHHALLILLLSFPYASVGQSRDARIAAQVKPAIFALSRVMMHDVVSPTIASRYYMYATIGGYAVVASADNAYPHPSRFIRHFPDTIGRYASPSDPALAALFSIYEAGMQLLPSGRDLQPDYDRLWKDCISWGYATGTLKAAQAHARKVVTQVLAYAREDNYRLLSSYPRYRPKRKPGNWFPTPPAYMDAVDPHWGRMRTLILDSSAQFPSIRPTPFDTLPGSAFMKLTGEVYQVSKILSPEQREIAGFWDCNPFVVATSGHMTLGFKKISPGGHWMNIACIAAAERKLSFRRTMQLVSLEAMTLYDAFISCWEEKYRSDRVRPESVINRYVDVKWQPLLQTPPFPEHTSGHSVISSASAELLSYLLGDKVSYTDDTEVIFELQPRRFTSFRQAAAEASVSRLYGGIHFRDAIEHGQEQGKRVGSFIVGRLEASGIRPF
jgi:hypothetical protein